MSLIHKWFILSILLQQTISYEELHKYVIVDAKLNFSTAENYCMNRFGTHLASIHNENDMNEVQRLCSLTTISNHTSCWIGLKNQSIQNTFYWTDHSYWDYGNNINGAIYPWTSLDAVAQPDSTQNCVNLHKNANFKWSVAGCDVSQNFICNMPSIICQENADKSNWSIFGSGYTNISESDDECTLKFVNAPSGTNLDCGLAINQGIGANVDLTDIVIEMSFEYDPVLPAPPAQHATGIAIIYLDDDSDYEYQFVKVSKIFQGDTWYHTLFISQCSGICGDHEDDSYIIINSKIYNDYPNTLRLDIYNNMMNVSINNVLINEQEIVPNYGVNLAVIGSIGIVGCNVNMNVSSLYISNTSTFNEFWYIETTKNAFFTTSTTMHSTQSNDGDNYGISVNITFIYHVANNTELSHMEIIKLLTNATKIALTADKECITDYNISLQNTTNTINISVLLVVCNETVQIMLTTEYKQNLEKELVQKMNNIIPLLIVTENNFKIQVDIIDNWKQDDMITTKMRTNTTLIHSPKNNSPMMMLYIVGASILFCVVLICCIIIYKMKKERQQSIHNTTEVIKSVKKINKHKKESIHNVPGLMVENNSSDEGENVSPYYKEIKNNNNNKRGIHAIRHNDYNKTSGNVNIGEDEFVIRENDVVTEGNNNNINNDEFVVNGDDDKYTNTMYFNTNV